jgi:hypothetical protein
MDLTSVEPYVGLFIQIPLVFIFIWFTLKIVDRFMVSLDKRDAALEARDDKWQAFLQEQRAEFSAAIASLAARFGDEIKSLSSEVSRMNGVLTAHDTRIQERSRKGE